MLTNTILLYSILLISRREQISATLFYTVQVSFARRSRTESGRSFRASARELFRGAHEARLRTSSVRRSFAESSTVHVHVS